uniref:Cadherin n=1 Tax=Schistosoma mansoni TaxID=6183 RepID=A0A5K4F2U9_SCHMA
MNEELSINTTIGNLLQYINGNINNLHFIKLTNIDDHSKLFTVNQYTGDIMNLYQLDRETLCTTNSATTYNQQLSSIELLSSSLYNNEQFIKQNHWKMNIPIMNNKCELYFSVNCLNTTPFLNISNYIKYKTPLSNKLVAIFDIIIELKDINDNGCKFLPSNEQIIRISEDAPVNDTRFILNIPYDPDDVLSGNSVKLDRIWINTDSSTVTSQSIQNYFKLHSLSLSKNGTIPNNYLELELIHKLDYEEQKLYTFQIIADDGYSLANHQCHLNVTILVEDCNDHMPRFEQSMYIVNISEDTLIDQIIIKLKAIDEDEYENGKIIYSFNSYTDDIDEEKFFYIDSDTGEIKLRNRLDYRQKPQHVLKVFAKNPDNTTSRHVKSSQIISELSVTQIIVNVIDVNDHFPRVRVLSPTGSKDLEIIEESSLGQDVGIVEVSDGDTGTNALVHCKIINQTTSGVLRLIPINIEGVHLGLTSSNQKYKITVEKRIDREENEVIEFTILCHDGGIPSLTTTLSQRIKIIDINDHDPICEQNVYNVEISEDSNPERSKSNFEIITIHATDKDEGQNAKLRFSLDHETPPFLLNIITIDSNSGTMSTLGNLDREKLNEFTVTIICSDYGESARTVRIFVHVKVLDYNDNSPSYSQPYYQFTLKENNAIGQLVGTFYVTDKDLGKNAELEIYIEENFERPNMYLTTLSKNLNIPNDLEQLRFNSRGLLYSSGLRQRKYIESISKFILTSYPLHTNYYNSFNTNETSYEVKLYIESIIDRENLIMKSTSYVSKALSTYQPFENERLSQFINKTNYSMLTPIIFLIVHANDKGIPKLSENVQIRIQILDHNDNSPRFIFPNSTNSNITKISLSYKEPKGYIFTQIQAVDDDAGENGTVIYFIHSGNDQNYFTLHKNTGTLSINKEIPYTAIGGLTLKIEARDCGQPYHYTRTDLILEIDDSPSKAYLSMNLYHLNNDDNDEFSSYGSSGYKLNFYIVIAIIVSSCIISTILISSVLIFLRRSKRNNVLRDVSHKVDNNHTSNHCTTTMINSPSNWSKIDQSQNYDFSRLSNSYRVVHSIPDCLSQFSSIGGQTSLELTNYPNGRLLSSPYQDSMLDKCSNRNISTEYWDYNNDNNNQGGINTIKMNRNNDLMDHQKIEIYIPSCQYMKMMDLTDETDLKYSYDARSNYYDETQRKFSLKAYPNDGIIQ